MVVVFSKALATKALNKLLNPGEALTSILLTGGFSQQLAGTTTQNRLIVAGCGWLSTTPKKPEIDIPITSVSKIDFLCSKVYGYIIIEYNGIRKTFRLGSSPMFDAMEEGSKMYKIITEANPSAAPAYLDGESTELMFRIKDGILKLTRKAIILINPGDNFQDVRVRENIGINNLKSIDCYPGKGLGEKSFLIIKTDNFCETITVGGVLSNTANYLPQKQEMSDSASDIVFKEILRRNHKARPAYLEFDEMPVVTMRVAHSLIGAIGGGNILRMTTTRIMELKPGNDELTIDYAINISDIKRTLLTTISDNSSETYKLEIFTNTKNYTYFAPSTYTYGYEAFKLIGETVQKLNNLR